MRQETTLYFRRDNNKGGFFMSAPSKANMDKLDNPARVTANHRHGTEPSV